MPRNALQIVDPATGGEIPDNPLMQGARAPVLHENLIQPLTLSLPGGDATPRPGVVNAPLVGATEPGVNPNAGLSLEQWPLRQQVGRLLNHTFSIKDPAGNNIGTLDTEFDPMMGELHIADIQAMKGANTIGPAAIRQLREALLEHYPEARTLSGYRTTGAGPDRETFQRLRPYQGGSE